MRPLHLALLTSALFTLAACSRPEAAQEPIRAVKLVTVTASGLNARQEMAGEVRARTESRLGFRVGGKLVQRSAEVGQRVKAGQVLARLDAIDLALASEAAKAQVNSALAQRNLMAADLKRFTDLKAQGFVSGAEIERRQVALDAADATLKQARAQSAVQGNQAGYTQLVADGDGVVVGVDAEVGQVVAAGAPVVRVARDGARDVVFAVPESQLAQLTPGLEAQVRLWAVSEAGAEGLLVGTVREIAASADPLTRTFQVKLALPADAQASLGATAYVTLPQAANALADVIKLPTSAVMKGSASDAANSAVWVFDTANGTVQSRPVQVAGVDGNQVVIASGLKLGEEVVAAGVHVLSAGQKVTRFVAVAQ